MLLLFFSIIFESSNQPGSVHVRRITDKHSVYAHKATADISLLGVRMPPPPTATTSLELYSVFHSAARAPVGLGGGGHGGHWCGLSIKKKKAENRIGHFFSLRVQMHTYPPAVALCLMSLSPKFTALRM